MVAFGGGKGVGQILAAVAAALLLRLFSGPGPELSPEDESDGGGDGEFENGEDKATGKVSPVTIRWSNITCSLSDKSSQAVSFILLSDNTPWHFVLLWKLELLLRRVFYETKVLTS